MTRDQLFEKIVRARVKLEAGIKRHYDTNRLITSVLEELKIEEK